MHQIVNSSIIMVFAIVAALGLVSVVAVDIMLTMQEVEAQKPRGCNRSVAANASQDAEAIMKTSEDHAEGKPSSDC
jgi:hypothetical protein